MIHDSCYLSLDHAVTAVLLLPRSRLAYSTANLAMLLVFGPAGAPRSGWSPRLHAPRSGWSPRLHAPSRQWG